MSDGDAFDLLSLEPQFDLPTDLLEKTYRLLQKSIHPDTFTGQSEIVRLAAARQASRINEAYQHLKNPLIRAELLLKRQGLWPLTPSPAALQEAMDLREEKMTAEDLAAFEKKVDELVQENHHVLSQAFAQKTWERAGEEYLRLSYLRKLTEE